MREGQPPQSEVGRGENKDKNEKQKSWVREHVRKFAIAAGAAGIIGVVGERIINPADADADKDKQNGTEQIAQAPEQKGVSDDVQFEVPENPKKWTATLDADSTEGGPDPDADQEAEAGLDEGEMRSYIEDKFTEMAKKYPDQKFLVGLYLKYLNKLVDDHMNKDLFAGNSMGEFTKMVDAYSVAADETIRESDRTAKE